MVHTVVVTTSYPERRGDAQGHFVAAEVRRLCEHAAVTVLAPGRERHSIWGERVVSLGGGEAFGFPGALSRLREDPRRALAAARFVGSALGWLRRAPCPERVIAHFLLPCGLPIGTRGLRRRSADFEVVVHGSDARLFASWPAGHAWAARELVGARARLRFVSSELQELVLSRMPPRERAILAAGARVEASPIDVDGALSRSQARAVLELNEDLRVAVIVGRLIPGKRVEVALEACSRVKGLTTIVIGDGPEQARLVSCFPRARFLGHVSRPTALAHLAAADVLVSASLEEGAPSVVREARALGTPVVCLAAGDLRRWSQTDPHLHVVG